MGKFICLVVCCQYASSMVTNDLISFNCLNYLNALKSKFWPFSVCFKHHHHHHHNHHQQQQQHNGSTKSTWLAACLRWIQHHILSVTFPGKASCFHSYHAVYDVYKWSTLWWYSFVGTLHIIMQSWRKALNTQNACQICSVKSVSKISSIVANISFTIYGGVCCQLTHFSFVACLNNWIVLLIIFNENVVTNSP